MSKKEQLKKVSGLTGVLFIGVASALLYTAPVKGFRRIGIGMGIVGGFLAGVATDSDLIKGDNGE